jgi:hypothetical protein
MLIKPAQFNFVDVFNPAVIGWENGHTRVQVKKKPGQGLRVYYVSGAPLSRIDYIRIAKELEK